MNRSRRGSYLLAAAVALSCAAAGAQTGSAGQQMPGQQPGGAPGVEPGASPGESMPSTATPSNSAQSFADQEFVRKALEDNVAQEQMGQLALRKSESDDVKEFGEKMVQVREQLTSQLLPIAKKLDVDEPKKPSRKERQEIEKMQALSGPGFDEAFLKAMLKDQQGNVKSFENEESAAQNPAVQQLAKVDAPVLSQHLQILKQIAQKHNVSTESEK